MLKIEKQKLIKKNRTTKKSIKFYLFEYFDKIFFSLDSGI